jgi:prepilin-type N-terminal cleavage/methylation domain-containing protein
VYKRAFTLIEALLVVSLIAILSLIAFENVIAAQTRAKISRNLADFRIIVGAVEAYHVDNNRYPRMAHFDFYGDPSIDIIQSEPISGVLSVAISTPVAYLNNAYLTDPFADKVDGLSLDEQLYTYQHIEEYIKFNPTSDFWPKAREYYGAWRLGGIGPDQTFGHGFANSAQLPYNPTNGTISTGNIWYSNSANPAALPPIPEMLGFH